LPLSRHPPFFSPTPSPSWRSTLSLHDALPILAVLLGRQQSFGVAELSSLGLLVAQAEREREPAREGPSAEVEHPGALHPAVPHQDRKSTRLNSSHVAISYAVFCLKKKKKKKHI